MRHGLQLVSEQYNDITFALQCLLFERDTFVPFRHLTTFSTFESVNVLYATCGIHAQNLGVFCLAVPERDTQSKVSLLARKP